MAIPGLKYEFGGNVPDEMQPFWNDEIARTIRSIDWWKDLWKKAEGIEIVHIREMACCRQAWSEWQTAYHPIVAQDLNLPRLKSRDSCFIDRCHCWSYTISTGVTSGSPCRTN